MDEKPTMMNDDRLLAFGSSALGILAVVFLFLVAAGNPDPSSRELLGSAVTAVTTLAAVTGGHAAGRAKQK
jgi:hypothetical protein